MFTGIIADIGRIAALETRGEDVRLTISTAFDMSTVLMGASIACDGVCLTVVEKSEGVFVVDVSAETLSCTTLSQWKEGDKINLERALKVGDELGGHIVSGHVDGLATLVTLEAKSDCHILTFEAPDSLKQYVAAKGSVTLNGISLTVNQVDDRQFTINVIPHTWDMTNLHALKQGSQVNLEIDVLARYIARQREVESSGLRVKAV